MRNYSLEEVEGILGCSRREVQKLINGTDVSVPRLPHFKIGSKKMVQEEDLEFLINVEMKMGKVSLSDWESEKLEIWEAQHVNCV